MYCFSLILLTALYGCAGHPNEKPVAATVAEKPVKRFGMVTGLKPDKVAQYKKLHAAVWPAVQKTITESNIWNYSIFLREIDEKFYLFS